MRFAVLALALFACSKKEAAVTTGSGSGSASGAPVATGSGSGSGSGSAEAPKGSGDEGSGAAVPDGPFDKLDHDGKVAVMKKKVMPAMRKAFADFDSEHFAKITCKTCHGKDPDAVKFKMPSPDLPKLDFKALEAGKDAKIADFMGKVVKPEMAKILQMSEMSQTNPQGFGCLDCHLEKK